MLASQQVTKKYIFIRIAIYLLFPQPSRQGDQELDNYYRKNIKPFVVILPQWEFLVDEHGKIRISNIMKFENLNEEFQKFCDKYNLKLDLPHINRRIRNKKITDYYDQELADMVYHIYRWDFKLLKFKKLIFRKSCI